MSYIYKTGRAELHDQIKRHARVIRGRVLDIGAGNFPRYKNLFNFDEYLRMDMTPGKDIDVAGSIEDIPLPDNSFDSVVCTQVLGDVYDLRKAFKEIYRILRRGGNVLITESLFDPLHDEPNDYWRFTPHSLRRLAEEANLKVEILEPRGGYRSVMSQLRARYWIERLNANNKWFSRILSFKFKVFGKLARLFDRRDNSRANKIFTHGYILICSK
ncbi:MAG: class I SAM-dependent methyltransferase [Minisyncoccia bacterium]